MAHIQNTATDYLDLLEDLLDFVTGQSVTVVAVAAGGTGYVVGDVLTAVGGTFLIAATFEVTSVGGGGDVTGIKRVTDGSYTVTPGNPVSTTGGTGTGATLTLTFASVGWTILRETQEAVSATVSAGGTGYTVSDQLTIVGGVAVGVAAVFNVDTVSGGVVTAVSLVTAGDYEETPLNPAATTGGTGTGATLSVNYQPLVGSDKVVILEGVGSGSDQIFVGIRTFAPTAGVFNWELAGMTGFAAANDFGSQPLISPGRFDQASPADEGAYVPLNNASLEYWFFADGRRILMVAKVGTTYSNMYLGFINQFSTSTFYAYPLLIMGCSSFDDLPFNTGEQALSGMVDPMRADGDDEGPGFLWQPGGGWVSVANSEESGANRIAQREQVVAPAGTPDVVGAPIPDEDAFFSNAITWDDAIPTGGNPGTPVIDIFPTDDSGGDIVQLVPPTIIQQVPAFIALGEIDAAFWMSARTTGVTILSEDEITVGGDTYIVFQNGKRTEVFTFFAIKRE